MNIRLFLRSAGVAAASCGLRAATRSEGWRTFEVTTSAEILKPEGATRVWFPTPLFGKTPFQRRLSDHFTAGGGAARMVESKADGLGILTVEFPAGVKPVVTLTSRVATRNFAVDLSTSTKPNVDRRELAHFLRSTKLLPTDGIVKETATRITNGAKSDLSKARAIYEWIVENTFRSPKVRGCGTGNIRFMLESQDFGGKCADLNALYVGLARAAGLPARDAYGIRVAICSLWYRCLGVASENVTKAQHCRAEVYTSEYGWVPVDPADVRKVVLEEPPGNRTLKDEMVERARARLFGSWEMNWMAYNFAHDVALPGSAGGTLGFLMYPQAETGSGRVDCLDPERFQYAITAREIGV